MPFFSVIMERVFDADIYGPPNKFEGYNVSIPIDSDEDDQAQQSLRSREDLVKKMSSYTAPKHFFEKNQTQKGEEEDYRLRKPQRIIDRENDYRKRRLNRKLSPPRHDPFAAGDTSPDASHSTYAEVMREQSLKRLEEDTYRTISQKHKEVFDSKGKEKGKYVKGRERRYDSKGCGFSPENRRHRVSGGGRTAAHSSKRRRP